MKIIVLGTRGFPNVQGGVEKHCEELYSRLAALGCEVIVLGRAPYIGKAPYVYKGVTLLPLACPKNKFLEAFVHTFIGIFKAKQLDADILHIHAIGPSLFVPLARLMGLKVVMTHHGPDYERKKWNAFAKGILKLGEQCGTGANQVIAVSGAIAKSLHMKFDREAAVIPNGVVVVDRIEPNGTLKRFNLEQGKYILAVGRFVPEKGFKELLDSFYQLSLMEQSRWKLVIAGDADHEDDFSRDLKRKSRGMANVVLTGYQTGESLQELYSHAGVFVLPSYHEGLPIVLLEALSYGNSCVVSDIPANREVELEDERYFKPGYVNLLARKLRKFINRPITEEDRLKRIQQIRAKYDWDTIVHKTLSVYEQVI